MKNFILLSATLLLMLFANAQIVNIPDANFKAALVNHSPVIDTSGDGEIQIAEAQATLLMYLSYKNISDLTGIEAFTSLDYLQCDENSLATLDISNNTVLTNLNCDNNQLSSLDVSNNTALTRLYCENNQLSSLDVGSNIALTHLWCGGNSLTTLDVSNNTALTELDCWDNNLTTIDISNNSVLERLCCWDNQLSTLDVSNNTALTSLFCENNHLISLNVRNGNNVNFIGFYSYDNPNLYCIEVDDSTWSTANWTSIDSWASFSNDCSNFVGTPNQLKTQELKLAPNPFNEKLSVLLPDNTNADNIEIALYNVLGKQIKVSTEKANNEIIINGANLHSGIYFVELREGNRLIGKIKIVKELY